jgi:hypothetical protein
MLMVMNAWTRTGPANYEQKQTPENYVPIDFRVCMVHRLTSHITVLNAKRYSRKSTLQFNERQRNWAILTAA